MDLLLFIDTSLGPGDFDLGLFVLLILKKYKNSTVLNVDFLKNITLSFSLLFIKPYCIYPQNTSLQVCIHTHIHTHIYIYIYIYIYI